jgi:hypothetical protein
MTKWIKLARYALNAIPDQLAANTREEGGFEQFQTAIQCFLEKTH